MKRSRPGLAVAALALLAALGWLAWRSTRTTPAPVAAADAADAAALAAPSAELLAALDSAGAQAAPAIEAQDGKAREALEVRTLQTRSASITVQPPKIESENRGMILVWCYLESSQASIDPEEILLLAPDGRELRETDRRQKGTFRGLAGGSYSVIVRDARFESVRVDSVVPGSHVLVDLMGTVRLRPNAVDAETGETIPTSTLRLVGYGRENELAPDAEGWFAGLPGGDLELCVRAPGYEDVRLEEHGLLAGESREVELRFSRAGEIRGIVVGAEGGAPLPNVDVGLHWQRTPDVMRDLMSRADLPGNRLRIGPALPARSDAQGRFTMQDLRFGEYSIVAYQGELLASVAERVVLTSTERVKEVVLRVPEGCSLVGTLTFGGAAADHGALGGMLVLVQLLGAPDPSRQRQAMAVVQPEGQFVFAGGLPVERVRILLALASQERRYDQDPPAPGTRVLGELNLHPGENECSFDISELLPGFADVEVVANGFAIDEGELLVAAAGVGSAVESYALRRGQGRVGPLPPGDYWVLARGEDAWLSSTPVALHIARGETTRLRVEPRLVRGKFVLQDEDGVALGSGTQVSVRGDGGSWPGERVAIRPKVGMDGEVELALEPGPYRVGLRTESALDWSQAGPLQPVLRVARRR